MSSSANIVLIAALAAAVITWWVIPHIMRIVRDRRLYDVPDGVRKIHRNPTPVLGGIAIFLGSMIAMVAVGDYAELHLDHYFEVSLVVLLFIGIADDLVPLPPLVRILFQALAAALVLNETQSWITNFNGVFGMETIPIAIAVPLSIFVVLVIMNAYNMIDGMDGLSGSQGLIAFVLFGLFFLANGDLRLALIAFAMAGALAGFLVHNRPPAKIFMGDTGTLVLGYALAYLAIKFVSKFVDSPDLVFNPYTPVLVIAVLIVPLFDMLRVVITRLATGRAMTNAGLDHVHHVLANYGFGARGVAGYLAAVQLLIVAFAVSMAMLGLNINVVLAGVLLVACVVLPVQHGYIAVFALLGFKPSPKANLESKSVSFGNVHPLRSAMPHRDVYRNSKNTREIL